MSTRVTIRDMVSYLERNSNSLPTHQRDFFLKLNDYFKEKDYLSLKQQNIIRELFIQVLGELQHFHPSVILKNEGISDQLPDLSPRKP